MNIEFIHLPNARVEHFDKRFDEFCFLPLGLTHPQKFGGASISDTPRRWPVYFQEKLKVDRYADVGIVAYTFSASNCGNLLLIEAKHYRTDILHILICWNPLMSPPNIFRPEWYLKSFLWWLTEYFGVSLPNWTAPFFDSNLSAKAKSEIPNPENWSRLLFQEGMTPYTLEWWSKIEELTRSYWNQHGKRALPISGKNAITLEKILNCNRKTIYEKTALGDKEVTQGNTK